MIRALPLEVNADGHFLVEIDHKSERIPDPFLGGYLGADRLEQQPEYLPLAVGIDDDSLNLRVLWAVADGAHKIGSLLEWEVVGANVVGQSHYDLSRLDDWPALGECSDLDTCPHTSVRHLDLRFRSRWRQTVSEALLSMAEHQVGARPETNPWTLSETVTGRDDLVDLLLHDSAAWEFESIPAGFAAWGFTSTLFPHLGRPLERALGGPYESALAEPVIAQYRQAYTAALDFTRRGMNLQPLSDAFRVDLTEVVARSLADVDLGFSLGVSPLTGRLCAAWDSTCIQAGAFPLQVLMFRDGADTYFEVRGGGWIGAVQGHLFPTAGRGLITSNPGVWAAFHEPGHRGDVLRAAHSLWSRRDRSVPQSREVRLVIPETRNLGHDVWQSLSGVALVCGYLGERAGTQADGSSADVVRRATVYRKSGVNWGVPVFTVFPLNELLNSLDGPPLIEATDQPSDDAVFEGMVLSAAVSEALLKYLVDSVPLPGDSGDLLPSNQGAGVTLFINVRSHSKSFLNMHECIPSAIVRAASELQTRISVELEGLDDAVDDIERLQRELRGHGISARAHVDLPLDQLIALVRECDAAITPIGSGMVIPTWVAGLPTLAHAEPQHLLQCRWWPLVSPRFPKGLLWAVPESAVSAVEDRAYSDYSIDVETFSDLLHSVLSRAVRERDMTTPANESRWSRVLQGLRVRDRPGT